MFIIICCLLSPLASSPQYLSYSPMTQNMLFPKARIFSQMIPFRLDFSLPPLAISVHHFRLSLTSSVVEPVFIIPQPVTHSLGTIFGPILLQCNICWLVILSQDTLWYLIKYLSNYVHSFCNMAEDKEILICWLIGQVAKNFAIFFNIFYVDNFKIPYFIPISHPPRPHLSSPATPADATIPFFHRVTQGICRCILNTENKD